MNLNDFNKLLWNHDWNYHFSDDHKVWKKGELEAERLKRLSKTSTHHLELYNAWVEWHKNWVDGKIESHPCPLSLYEGRVYCAERKEELKQDLNNSFEEYRSIV